jgi:hypothetical protein
VGSYCITADVPQFSSTGSSVSAVPVAIFMEIEYGEVMSTVDVGTFTYVGSGEQTGNSTPQDVPRKREISAEDEVITSPRHLAYGFPNSVTASLKTQSPQIGNWPGYALYPHKAKLEIQGDLDAMAREWSEDEFETRRRLVHFRREQSGSTITTSFKPVAIDERPPHSVCISCIYWEEKQECFVTAVDIIYLLEQLIAARFTVEDKNRIRKNLEGFRPLTVSKGKSDPNEFFKVIMAFPTPKPRNIEKDIKVFHWKDLSSILKKIIGKYVSNIYIVYCGY